MENIACRFTAKERNSLANQLDKHASFRKCHPTAEVWYEEEWWEYCTYVLWQQHLVPFHVALGAAGSDKGKKLLQDYYSTLSWGSYAFGLPEDTTLPTYDGSQAKFWYILIGLMLYYIVYNFLV